MNRKLEQSARVGLAAALFVFSAGNNGAFAAEAAQGTGVCEKFFQKISTSDWLKDMDLLPREIEHELTQCGTGDSKVALVLKQFFRYRPAMDDRDFPNQMAHLPNTDFVALHAHDAHEMNDALKKLKSMDKNDVEQVLRFMASQPENSYQYSWPAFEIAARLYPEEYDSFESLTQSGTEGRRAWEFEKKRWITEVDK